MAQDHQRQIARTAATSTRQDLFVFVLLWLPYAWLVRRFWFLCDDAFITFRYARNWAAGDGLRYNLGEHVPVEGYSNFLWLSLCSVIDLLGGSVVAVINWISLTIGSALLFGVFHLLRRRFQVALMPAALATLSVGCFPPFAVWSTSGLETIAFAALTFATFERLVLRRGAMAPIAGALAGLGMSLLRVEGFAWAVGIGVIALVSRLRAGERPGRMAMRYAALLGLSFVGYWTCRSLYFESLLPNTAHAKSTLTLYTVTRGLRYVGSFCLAFMTPLAILLTARAALGGRRPGVGLPVLIVVFAVYGFAVIVGGDFMAMGRFLVPAVAFQGLLLGWFLDDLDRRASWLVLPLGLTIVAVGLLPAWNLHVVPEPVRNSVAFRHSVSSSRSELDQWGFMHEGTRLNTFSGHALRWHARSGESLVRGAIGAAGYYSGLFVLDRYGLVNREVARRSKVRANQSAGHDKKVQPGYFLDQRPDYMYGSAFPASSLPAVVDSRVRRWKADTSDLYVPELIRLPPSPDWDDGTCLVLYRLRTAEESRQAAWSAFEEAMDKLVTARH